MKGEFISPIFLVPKKDGGSRPVINLKTLNSHIVYQHFKMEGLHLLKYIIQEKDFMIKIDLKDAYFCVPMSQQYQPFLRFIWGGGGGGGHTVSVHLPPFWSSSCPSLLHKAIETSGGPVTQTWLEGDCLSRRYHCVQSDSGGNISGQGLNPLVTSAFGFCNQLEEISVRSFTLHGVPRLCDKFTGNELNIAKGKNESTHPVLQRLDSGKNCLRQNLSLNNWETDFVNAGCSPCTLALPTLANVASERSSSREELRDNGTTQPKLSERPAMVDGSDLHLEWWVNNYSSPRSGNNDRCITAELGSSLPRGSHEGTLVSAGIKHPSYQCIGAESSVVCCESFHCQRKAVACPPENGQQDSSGLCIENGGGGGGGGDTILGIGRNSPGIMRLCSEKTNYTDSRIFSWKIQSRGPDSSGAP